jgi:hypothetical protein
MRTAIKNISGKIRKNSERGQAIILIAFAIVGLVAIVGLMIDGGILLIEYARLKRGIDAASIASASQFRKDFVGSDLEKAGEEFLKFNQSVADVTVYTCDTPGTTYDTTLCSNPPRKLVRITANRHVDFGFMRIVGINGTNIEATSVGEAASVDLVLVIDTSSSMAYDTNDYTPNDGIDNDPADLGNPTGLPGDNVEVCNTKLPGTPGNGRCEPLGQIIDVAVDFVEDRLLFYPYDQVALISTAGKIMPDGNQSRDSVLVLPFNNNYNETTKTVTSEIQTAIRSLRVFQPVHCGTTAAATTSLGGCIRFTTGTPPTYDKIGCDRYPTPGDTSSCGSSNVGGSLYLAGAQFDNARQESFWVTIALLGGPATATNSVAGKVTGFCPPATWTAQPALTTGRGCRDYDTTSTSAGFNPATFDWTDATRHNFTIDNTDPLHPIPIFPANYDADDYARDAADYVTSRVNGQGATLYSICLGNLCRSQDASGTNLAPNRADPWSGDHLGEYIAEHSGDSANNNANPGLYKYAADPDDLIAIFTDIANNIFTRISQ